MLTTTPTFQALSDALDRAALRQAVYSANIANAGVDGYRRMEVSFDAEVERATLAMANMTRSGVDMQSSTGIVATSEVVQLDQEMALLAQNALKYQSLLGSLERQLGLLRMAIKEGRE
jgi:flagellar basal-body rod protein FlgB